jgi:hypothetical protein
MAQQKAAAAAAPRDDAHPCLKLDAIECMEVLTNWNLSMLNFYMNRAQAYWALPTELPALLTPDDCVDAQEQFLATMVADYAAQAERLRQIVPEGVAQPDESCGTGYEQGLLKAQADAAKIIDQAKRQAARIMADAEKRASALSGAPAKAAGEVASATGDETALKKSA